MYPMLPNDPDAEVKEPTGAGAAAGVGAAAGSTTPYFLDIAFHAILCQTVSSDGQQGAVRRGEERARTHVG